MDDEDHSEGPSLRRHSEHLRALVLVILFSGIIGALAALDSFYLRHNSNPTRAHIYSTDVRRVTVDNVTFSIPVRYFHPLSVEAGGNTTTTVLLNVELPDITPQTLSDIEYLALSGKFRPTRLLIASPDNPSGRSRLPYKDRATRYSERVGNTARKEDVYGLTLFTRPEGVRSDMKETLIEGELSNPATFIKCSPSDGPMPYPSCQMTFEFRGLVIEVDFRRSDWLSEWRYIKDATIERLNEFAGTRSDEMNIGAQPRDGSAN